MNKENPEPPVYIYCSVTFSKGGISYYYITDDTSLEVGDPVLVPVEYYGRTGKARITKIEHFAEELVPYPLKRVKRIIRKLTEKEYRMPTMFFEAFTNNDNKTTEQESSLPTETNKVELCSERIKNTHYYIVAESLANGLLIWGIDSGKGVEAFIGEDFEYEYKFDKINTNRLVELLTPEGKDIKEILAEKFSGKAGFDALMKFCKENNIEYEYRTIRR